MIPIPRMFGGAAYKQIADVGRTVRNIAVGTVCVGIGAVALPVAIGTLIAGHRIALNRQANREDFSHRPHLLAEPLVKQALVELLDGGRNSVSGESRSRRPELDESPVQHPFKLINGDRSFTSMVNKRLVSKV